jgi:hypothetical protein
VWDGVAEMTPGCLRKGDLLMNERGRIVSARRHCQGLKAYRRNMANPRFAEFAGQPNVFALNPPKRRKSAKPRRGLERGGTARHRPKKSHKKSHKKSTKRSKKSKSHRRAK